jgi:regulator of RNase E activity RraA
MKRAEWIVIAFVVGFICGAAFTVKYMGGNEQDARLKHNAIYQA